jgi:glycosyltransferase involved in cell wall biosynthesis
MFGRFDGVVSISAVDTALIRRQCPSARIHEMPAGYALNEPAPLRPDMLVDPRLCFVGSLDYTANRDGLAWFVAEVWPAIRARFPAASLTVAGRSATAVRFLEDAPGVRYVGFVANVKILDLLSRGVPTISTTVGAEGTRTEHGGTKVVALADDAAQFVAQIARLASDAPARFAMAREGRRLIAAQYDWRPLVSGYCDWAASLPVRGG